MLRRILLLAALCAPLALAAEPLRVVTTIPDMADFVRQIGGDEVTVTSISGGKVDIHFFVPRPRHASMLRRADLLVVGGLAVDVWANGLIDSARNPAIRYGADGYLDPAVGVKPLEVPEGRIDGSHGDVHPFGNPHYWFTERNVAVVLRNVTKRLCALRPEKAAYFRKNEEAYREKVTAAFAASKKKLAPFKGVKIVQYHKSWTYFAQEFGLQITGDLEPKPGIPPSARHLSDLIERVKADGAKLIIAEPDYPAGPIQTVAGATGAAVLRLPIYVGGRDETPDYLSNLTRNVEDIARALGGT